MGGRRGTGLRFCGVGLFPGEGVGWFWFGVVVGEGGALVVFVSCSALGVAGGVEESVCGVVCSVVASAFAVVCFEAAFVPVLVFVFVHWLSAPPAWCSVFVVVEESSALGLVFVAESFLGGGGFLFFGSDVFVFDGGS